MSKPSVYVIAYNDEPNMRACLLGRMAYELVRHWRIPSDL